MIDPRLFILKGRVFEAASAFIGAGSEYFEARNADPDSGRTRRATEQYHDSAVPYLVALNECEAYLRSIERDEDQEADLGHILTFQRGVYTILDNLDAKKPLRRPDSFYSE